MPSRQELRVGDAAAYLGCHPKSLRRWAKEGQVAYRKSPGGWHLFLRQDLDDFLERSRHEVEGT